MTLMHRRYFRDNISLPIRLAEGWALVILNTLLGYGAGSIALQHGYTLTVASIVGFIVGGLLLLGVPFVIGYQSRR
jgi:hypothetical protein